MSRVIQAALILVLASTAVWTYLPFAFFYGPILRVNFHLAYTVPLALLLPIFFARPIAVFIINARGSILSLQEVIVLCLVSIVGCGVGAFVIEAWVVSILLPEIQDITFQDITFREILTEPLRERYSVTALYGLSVFTSALIVTAFVAAVRIPMIVSAKIWAKPADRIEQEYRLVAVST